MSNETKKMIANQEQLHTVQGHFDEIKRHLNEMIKASTNPEYYKGDPNKEIVTRVAHESRHVMGLLSALAHTSQINSCTGEIESLVGQLIGLGGLGGGAGN